MKNSLKNLSSSIRSSVGSVFSSKKSVRIAPRLADEQNMNLGFSATVLKPMDPVDKSDYGSFKGADLIGMADMSSTVTKRQADLMAK